MLGQLPAIPLPQEESTACKITKNWALRHALADLPRPRAARNFKKMVKQQVATFGIIKNTSNNDSILLQRLNTICPNQMDAGFWDRRCKQLLCDVSVLIDTYKELIAELQ